MNIWMYISLMLVAGLIAEFIIVWKLEKEKNKEIDTLNYANAELKKEIHDILEDESLVSKSYIELKKEYEELQKLRNTMIKPTIHVEKPVVETFNIKMALPYYNKENEKEVMDQIKQIIAYQFEKDLFEYIDWFEYFDPVERERMIQARLRILKPVEKYHED